MGSIQPSNEAIKGKQTLANKEVLDGENYMETHIIDDYRSDRAAAYYADQNKVMDRPIIFDQTFLGLAIETPPPKETLQSLWRVV